MKSTLFTKKWLMVLLHIISWLLLFSLPYMLQSSAKVKEPPHSIGFEYHYLVDCVTWIALFYINAYLLIPRFINTNRLGTYMLLAALVIAAFVGVDWFSISILIPEVKQHWRGFIAIYLFLCLFFLAASTAIRMMMDRTKNEMIARERETETLRTELLFLRSQVSPHFMFNVLNNMVALARKKSDLLEPSLIKLSALLRYMLYETGEQKVSLSKEIEYLRSYIDLQLQRFGKNVRVNAHLEEVDASYQIEPMLLIPFVENAFKHGTGMVDDAYINICLKAVNGILSFTVTNKFNGITADEKDKTSGIGLNNVARRLDLMYLNNHTLKVTRTDHEFIVELNLKIH